MPPLPWWCVKASLADCLTVLTSFDLLGSKMVTVARKTLKRESHVSTNLKCEMTCLAFDRLPAFAVRFHFAKYNHFV